MKRAAIYARFSTDLQADRSINDQVALCRAYADRLGFEVAAVFADRALSGSSIHQRTGLAKMLAAARDCSFEVLIAETMSRIGRDEEDRAAVRKRLTFAGIEIMTPVDGVVSRLTDGIKAVIDSQYLEDLKVMIRRGLAGVVRDGRSPGGRAYGYRPVPGKPGVLAIEADEAVVVRRIFAEYVAGKTPREIAATLNHESVKPPRGSRWGASAILGEATRGSGILSNRRYIGEIVWNKVRMVRDPDTGRRVSRPNPVGEHQTALAPNLAIVSTELFAAASKRRAARTVSHPVHARKPRHLLSGLLKCAACGAGMSAAGRDRSGRIRVRCTASVESGTCPDPKTFYLDVIEQTVTAGLQRDLLKPEAVRAYVEEYQAERRRLALRDDAERNRLERRLVEIDREAERCVDQLVKGIGDQERIGARSKTLGEEERSVRAQLAGMPAPTKILSVHPRLIDHYRTQVARLAEGLTDGLAG